MLCACCSCWECKMVEKWRLAGSLIWLWLLLQNLRGLISSDVFLNSTGGCSGNGCVRVFFLPVSWRVKCNPHWLKKPKQTNQPKKPPQKFLNRKCEDRTYWIPEPFWMLNLTFWDFLLFLSAFMKNISVFHLSHVINWILVILTGFLAPGMYLLTTPWIRSWEPDCVNGSRRADCKDSLVFYFGGSDLWSS